jgi:large subunit ribosomal protein L7A
MNNIIEGKKIVGAKQTLKAVKSESVDKVYIAEDAEIRITKSVVETCKQCNVEVIYVDTMQKLGTMVSIDVGAAVACVLKNS